MDVNHQIDWGRLVASGRAKAFNVMWTKEDRELLKSGEETVASLRDIYNAELHKGAAKRVATKKAPVKKVEKVEEEVKPEEVVEPVKKEVKLNKPKK